MHSPTPITALRLQPASLQSTFLPNDSHRTLAIAAKMGLLGMAQGHKGKSEQNTIRISSSANFRSGNPTAWWQEISSIVDVLQN